MSDLQILFNSRKSQPIVGGFYFDLSLDERHSFDNEVTTFPVENGSNITDNVSLQPIRLSLTGFVTNAPIIILQNSKDATFLRSEGRKGRTELMFEAMKDIRDNKTPVSIVTGLISYDNMVLTSLTIPRNASMGDTLQISMEFTQIRYVNTSKVAFESLALDTTGAKAGTSTRASKTKDAGSQNTKTPKEQEESALYGGVNTLLGLN